MLTRKFSIILFILFSINSIGQSQIFVSGKVSGKNEKGIQTALVGATLRWQNSKSGEITDPDGFFKIKKEADNHQLIISITGYKSDTLMVHSTDFIEVVLKESNTYLDAVTVRGSASVMDKLSPIQTEIITSSALKKAACCNLSESFETNSSVSVSYSDAITGSKQIQLLGLSGNYVQMNTENIPNIRGLNTTFGLNYTPGTWINSIDISKGVGSVINGYEAMTGAINVELVKPESSDKLFINSYLNSQGRAELNVQAADTLSKKWSVALLTHISSQIAKIDGNSDQFLDVPLYKQLNLINRWKYSGEKFATQFGIKYLTENRVGGQISFNPKTDQFTNKSYGFDSDTKRLEVFAKLALLFPSQPYQGLGLIINALNHNNESYFGFKKYTGAEKSIYSNLIYQNIIGNTNHTYKLGSSLLLDNYHEFFIDSVYKRNEVVPGIFAEYIYTFPEKITIMLGNRIDFHNLYGNRMTPRVHFKYDINENSQLRINWGKGWRMPNTVAENFGMFVNSRSVSITEVIKPEESINYGASFSQEYQLYGKKGSLILDFYKTSFQNQLVTDMENAGKVLFYNLKGKSFANSFQAELNYNPAERFDLKLAYRLFDVKNDFTTYNGETVFLAKQFVNKDRLLFNAAYATKWNKWKYDFTWQWNGKRRIPNPAQDHLHTKDSPLFFAPAFSNINAQVTKVYKNWEFYLGGENLGNFKQKNPIMGANDPFGATFDASMVWGPVAGRVIYSGLRWKLSDL
ncbi:MAG: TonB-dependent receptor [Bacteroidota bacterium]